MVVLMDRNGLSLLDDRGMVRWNMEVWDGRID